MANGITFSYSFYSLHFLTKLSFAIFKKKLNCGETRMHDIGIVMPFNAIMHDVKRVINVKILLEDLEHTSI